MTTELTPTDTTDITVTGHRSTTSYDAVLFDLSGTLIDDGYIDVGFTAVAHEMRRRWAMDEAPASAAMFAALRDQLVRWASRPYFPMCDAMVAAIHSVVAATGRRASNCVLHALDAMFWEHAIPAAMSSAGARETLARLRSAGIRTGIVSFADIGPFRALLDRTGLAGLTDVELCSEEAKSCKPDPEIFRQALAVLGVAPERSLFVGDSIDSDIVGANRVGTATALLVDRAFAITAPDSDHRNVDPDRRPTFRITQITDVTDLLLGSRAAAS
jgi:putative hydrolase of the HAD superfamily